MNNHARFHLGATFIWALLAIPTFLWWKESILWVAAMSLYANLAGHWSAFEASRSTFEKDIKLMLMQMQAEIRELKEEAA